ncbi:hypothetical protein D3C77_634160 [compost metagenome]
MVETKYYDLYRLDILAVRARGCCHVSHYAASNQTLGAVRRRRHFLLLLRRLLPLLAAGRGRHRNYRRQGRCQVE